jgi:N-formylglutamate deformylase
MEWPADFEPAASREAILTTWDAFVDDLWGGAPSVGATLLAALFPRAYIDANRAADDIDETLLAEPWPTPLAPTAYTQRGMGLIRRHALPQQPMYDRPLTVTEVEQRLARYYHPYRDALAAQLAELHERFGVACHVNVHSMKSHGNAMNVDAGAARPDVVVSDRHGVTAAPSLTAWAADWFRARGLRTQVNDPYQGGDIVARSGSPAHGRHSIQIEFNRAVYMDEARFTRGRGFTRLRERCTAFVRDLAVHVVAELGGSSDREGTSAAGRPLP